MASSKFAMSQFAALSEAAQCAAVSAEAREVLAHMAAQKAAQSAKAKNRPASPAQAKKDAERAEFDASILAWAKACTAEDAEFTFASIDAARALGGATATWQKYSAAISRLMGSGAIVGIDAKGKHLHRVA